MIYKVINGIVNRTATQIWRTMLDAIEKPQDLKFSGSKDTTGKCPRSVSRIVEKRDWYFW